MDLGLTGKTVIVTGGGSNIGRGIVLTFAREGANTVIAELDEKQGAKVVDEASSLGGHAILVKTDATDWDSVRAMAEAALQSFGKIDVLVNNVGYQRLRPFAEKSIEECESEISINYRTVVNCTKAVVNHMIERRYGKIISIGSTGGESGRTASGGAVYGSTKAAVILLSRALAWELGGYGINVNVVCPSLTVPESLDHVGEKTGWRQWAWEFFTPEMQAKWAKACPLRRVGRPQDIANAVVFLASDCASYITGQALSVSGGVTA